MHSRRCLINQVRHLGRDGVQGRSGVLGAGNLRRDIDQKVAVASFANYIADTKRVEQAAPALAVTYPLVSRNPGGAPDGALMAKIIRMNFFLKKEIIL